MPDRRLKAVWNVNVPVIRELAGVREYEGMGDAFRGALDPLSRDAVTLLLTAGLLAGAGAG